MIAFIDQMKARFGVELVCRTTRAAEVGFVTAHSCRAAAQMVTIYSPKWPVTDQNQLDTVEAENDPVPLEIKGIPTIFASVSDKPEYVSCIPEVAGSNPVPATDEGRKSKDFRPFCLVEFQTFSLVLGVGVSYFLLRPVTFRPCCCRPTRRSAIPRSSWASSPRSDWRCGCSSWP
jgi:hypothetical protein